MFIRYYAVISKWVFTEVNQGNAEAVSLLLDLLPGLRWNNLHRTLQIYDTDLTEPDLNHPEDIDEWESYFSHCTHDPEFAPYILPILDIDKEFIEKYREVVLQRVSRLTGNSTEVKNFLDLVLDCLDTSYMDS